MASEKQYNFFKSVFDEERRRYVELAERAKLYQGVITLYVGALTLKFDDVSKFIERFRVSVWLFLATAVILLISLVMTVLATRIRTYERITDLQNVIRSFGPTPPSDEEFFDDRLVDLAVATERNAAQNQKVAALLTWASWLLCAAIAIQIASAGWAFSNELKGSGGHEKKAKAEDSKKG